ncbi:MAG: glycosyltransferase family 39 protein [Burkholderiales bacterium]|nr:glycosyltransferase family 39 protein [Burkholderiales bacterium]
MNDPSARPLPSRLLLLLLVLLAVHAAILVWAAAGPLAIYREDHRWSEFALVTFVSLAACCGALAWFGQRTRMIAMAASVAAAAALLTPGAVAVVALAMLNAHVVGTRLLRFAGVPGGRDAPLPWTIPVLVGCAVWIGLLASAGSFKIHYAPVYALLLLGPLAYGWPDTMAAFARLGSFMSARDSFSGTERGWIALLLTMLLLHLFIVARPEVGYDASTMHLQFAALVNDAHRWRFDVGRYAWAVMPLGADWAYAAAYVVGGENAARAANLAFGILAAALVYQLVRRHARSELALASVCMLVSIPIAFAETGSLYVENLWSAFLLAAVLVTLRLREGMLGWSAGWPLLALLAAGAMQSKVIGVLWLGPLLAYALLVCSRRPPPRMPGARGMLLVAIAATIAAWPYVNAWLRTGNPVFPFMNSVFRSPLADTATSFTNPVYAIPLRPWSLYEVLTDGHRFIEGANGAAGFHWLLLIALIVVAALRRRHADFWVCAALAAIFFVAVYSQQAYLRYLFPAFMLLAVLGGWAATELGERLPTRIAMLVAGGLLCVLHVRLMHTGAWANAQLCIGCAFDAEKRREFASSYMGDRIVADYLNRTLPDARVGFLMLNGPSPAGYVGYSRAANWHDNTFFQGVAAADSAADIDTLVQRYGLTHIVYRTANAQMDTPAVREFRQSRLTPLWRFQDFVVATIDPRR